jgi:hypothetical protein
MPTKDEVLPELIKWHFQVDPAMIKVYRFLSPDEDDLLEPIKFLEVSPDTPASGSVMTFTFGGTEDVPYRTTIATITPEEMEQIARSEIPLPPGWNWDEKQDVTALALPPMQANGHKP